MKLSFSSSVFDTRGLVKLGRLSGDYLTLSSCWISLTKKLAIYERMDLVAEMVTYLKRTMRPNTLGMISHFLSLS